MSLALICLKQHQVTLAFSSFMRLQKLSDAWEGFLGMFWESCLFTVKGEISCNAYGCKPSCRTMKWAIFTAHIFQKAYFQAKVVLAEA